MFWIDKFPNKLIDFITKKPARLNTQKIQTVAQFHVLLTIQKNQLKMIIEFIKNQNNQLIEVEEQLKASQKECIELKRNDSIASNETSKQLSGPKLFSCSR